MPICAHCGRENTDDARFCSGCGTQLEASRGREERKVVTVLFADIVGSTARAERLDPEDVRAFLAPFHAKLRHELERHGGTVEKFIGDAVVGVFGAPATHEDDPERAVRAALAIQEATTLQSEADPGHALEVRIGVNTGEALIALDARPELGEGMVSGDVINTAARLQSASPAGAILVGEQTQRAVERAIELVEHPPIDAKGKTEPIPCWLVVGPRASYGLEDDAVGGAPLVGRTREVALLADALARVRSDERPQLVTLVGVPGIGKSRLVHELREIVAADPELITWRRGRSLPYGEGVAYWALGEIVKAQAGILESDGAELAATKLDRAVGNLLPDRTEAAWIERHLRPLVGLPAGDARSSREEAFTGWRRFLEALAEERPAVLVFEDLHWADDDLLDFVDELSDSLESVPLLLVCTARPELLARRPGWGGGKLNAVTLSLTPLSDDETAELLATLLERSVLPAELQTKLIERAEGVPLFAEEYARMLVSGDVRDEMPDTLQGVVAARIDGLPHEAKEVLQDAAVLGKVFWSDALVELTGLERAPLEERLRLLERQEFVRRERRSAVEGARQYVFLHAIVREVAYGQIPRAARSLKHRATAEWIVGLPADRGEDRAETLAHHLESAMSYGHAAGVDVSDLGPVLARALRDAGDRAFALNIVSRAAQYYRRAIDASESNAADPELLARYVETRMWAEGVEGGAQGFEEAIDALLSAGRGDLAALSLIWLERTRWNAGQPEPALLDRALALVADAGPTPVRGRVIGFVATRWAIGGRASDALPLAEEALSIARAHGQMEAEAEALNNLAVAQANAGDSRAALETARASLELALECGASDLPRPYVNVASFEYDVGDLAGAERHHREGLALAERLGNRAGADWLSAEVVLDCFERGAWDEALGDAQRLLRGRTERGTAHYMDPTLRLVEVAIALAREGRLRDGALDDTLATARTIGDAQLLVPTLGHAARIFSEAGRPADAEVCLVECLEAKHSAASFTAAGSWTLAAALAWLTVMREPVPDELLEGPDVPWTQAVRLTRDGATAAGADVLAAIGAVTMEAELRLHAARVTASVDVDSATRQLDLATEFWRSVGATARLTRSEEVRASLRRVAS